MSTIDETETENLNRFNNIIQNLPIRTKLTVSSLCLLDNISTQLLRFLIFNSNSPQVIALYTEHGTYLSTGETEIFQTLLKLFKQVRLIYNTRSPLLHVHDVAPGLWFPNSPPPSLLRGHESYIITSIRKANLLTFILTALGCFSYGFELLQSSFLDIFCPNTLFTGTSTSDQNGKFLKSQAILYLDLKTQAFIAGLKDFKDATNEIPADKKMELLQSIFPDNLADQLILRRTGSNSMATNDSMTPSERDFIERCDRRRDNLSNFTDFNSLVQSYDWNHFIKELLDYCNRNMGLIIWGRRGRGKSPLFAFDKDEFDNQVLYASGASAPSADFTNLNVNEAGPFENNEDQINSQLTASNINPGQGTNDFSPSLSNFGNGPQGLVDNGKRMTQSLVSAAIAASASSGIKKLKPKRIWSKDEEEALTEGLKEVGPSWSKILDLYGPGGKISEDLKNRTQVQLKDKARNWKLHYLKTDKELPEYLRKVTGNLDKALRSKKKTVLTSTSNTASPVSDVTAAGVAAAIATATATNDPSGLNESHENSVQPTDSTGVSLEDPASQASSQAQKNLSSNGLFDSAAGEAAGFDPNLENSM